MKITLRLLLVGFLSLAITEQSISQQFTERAADYNINLAGAKDGGFSFGYLNGDEHLDLIVNTYDGQKRSRVYFFEPASGKYIDVTSTHAKGILADVLEGSTALERSLVIVDFNNDGYYDFVRNSAFRVEVYLNNGPGAGYTFGRLPSQLPNFVLYTADINDPSDHPFKIPGGMNTEGIGALDYDNDGDLDLFIENHNWGVEIYENTTIGAKSGDNLFVHVLPTSIGLPLGGGTDPSFTYYDGDYATVTDINNDGYIDMLARKNGRNAVDLYINNPENPGNFMQKYDIQNASNENKGAVSFYDLDNDNDFDLIWTASKTTEIYELDANGDFVLVPGAFPSNTNLDNIDGLAGGDIDHDGDIDIFLADDQGSSFLMINETEAGGPIKFVQSNNGIDVNGDAEGALFTDVDEDGDLDLYVNLNGLENQLWINDLNTTEKGNDFIIVKVLENRDTDGNIGNPTFENAEGARLAHGANAVILDYCGNVVSGLRELNGGNGHGTQGPPLVHFGLPNGYKDKFFVRVSYPDLLNDPNGRLIIEKEVKLAELQNGNLLVVSPDMESDTINRVPVAVDDSYTIICPADSIAGNVGDNDYDPDSTVSVFSLATDKDEISGDLTFNEDGSFVYYNNGFVGIDSFQYVIADPCGTTDSAMVRIDVTCDGEECLPPTAGADTLSAAFCGEPILIDVAQNDSSSNGLDLVYDSTLVIEAQHGTVAYKENGIYAYMPENGFLGEDSFSYRVCTTGDTCGMMCDTASVTINVLECPADCVPPTAGADTLSAAFCGEPILIDVAQNDSSSNGLDLVYDSALVIEAQHGSVVLKENGIYAYMPENGFLGEDTFSYRVCTTDDKCGTMCDTASVAITVLECPVDCVPPTANADSASALVCDPFINIDVSANDESPSGEELVYDSVLVQNPAFGSVKMSSNGTFTYTPDFITVGLDSFAYRVCTVDTKCGTQCDTAYVFVEVESCDLAPPVCKEVIAIDDTLANAICGEVIVIDATANDSIPEGVIAIYSDVTLNGPEHGTISMTVNGIYNYTPDKEYDGEDKFSYVVCTEATDTCEATCDTATVYINVSCGTENCLPPVAEADTTSGQNCGEPFFIDVAANDFSPNGIDLVYDTLPVVLPEHGSVSLMANGTYSYLPEAGFEGEDSFSYRVCTSNDTCATLCDTATVTITVLPCDDIEECEEVIAMDDSVSSATCGVEVVIDVTTNDSIPKGIRPIYSDITLDGPKFGTLIMTDNGIYTYTATENFSGEDKFSYIVCTEAAGLCESSCDTATVYINVSCDTENCLPPVAEADTASGQNCGEPFFIDVAANDFSPNGIDLVYDTLPVVLPQHGSVSLMSNSTYSYIPESGFEGEDTFSYRVCTSNDTCATLCDTAMVTITVLPCNIIECEEVVAVDDTVASASCGVEISIDVSANDLIPSGVTATYNATTLDGPEHGTITMNANGVYQYTAEADYTGEDMFSYIVCTEATSLCEASCDTATVYITVECETGCDPACTDPIANDDEYTVTDCSIESLTENVALNDELSIACGSHIFSVVEEPQFGTVEFENNGDFVYTPTNVGTGFSGDQFVYEVCNDCGKCDTATVQINIQPEIFTMFSPNNDGVNDFWQIDCVTPGYKVQIFNRWGNLVFEARGGNDPNYSYAITWKGETNKNTGISAGTDVVPDGTYFFLLYDQTGKLIETAETFIVVKTK
ncbi:Ig-like domain-containing protein [Flammeovirgaceae bacterium SG7u.111]|nr:Ig-like domain-containing protein [Flammeovirgaceae bacterium SG7u.132]WPO33987.1 Ig-like domain-containing protein [Flammeovirgaceae bacterium SG7u.111]